MHMHRFAEPSSPHQPRRRPRPQQQRGFVHILLLVLAVLGISLWGVSEMQQWADESERRVAEKTSESLRLAKQAILNYALLPPARLESAVIPGRYNAYAESGRKYPFSYFYLPCPDNVWGGAAGAGGDFNLDGASDILEPGGCRVGFHAGAALAVQSSFGRLPWRDEHIDDPSSSALFPHTGIQYARGLGGTDLRDGYNNRLWYAAMIDLMPDDRPANPAARAVLNPHSIMRRHGNFFRLYDPNGGLINDRIVVMIMSPGRYGGADTGARIPEEELYDGVSAATLPASRFSIVGGVPTTDWFIRAYLHPRTWANIGSSQTSLLDPADPTADIIEYITIDELMGEGSEGIRMVEEAPRGIYDMVAGEEGFVGMVALLDEHLQRHGYLPPPAVFSEEFGTSASRPSGFESQFLITVTYNYERLAVTLIPTVTVNPLTTMTVSINLSVTTTVTMSITGTTPVQQGAHINTGSSAATIALRLSDLPPVYLASEARLSIAFRGTDFPPPYGVQQAELAGDLAEGNLPTAPGNLGSAFARISILLAANHMPGAADLPTYDPNDPAGISGLYSPNLLTVLSAPPAPSSSLPIPVSVNVLLAQGQEFAVLLADSAYGYFVDDTLLSLVSLPNNKSTLDIAKMPPFAAKAYLPAGTRLTLRSDNIVVKLPSDFTLPPGSSYDYNTGNWMVAAGSEAPLQIIAGDNKWVLTETPPNRFPAIPGDMGFLPSESATFVRDDTAGVTISLSAAGGAAVTRLARAVTLVYSDISNIQGNPTQVFTNIARRSPGMYPFPPPGRPAALPGLPVYGAARAAAASINIAPPFALPPLSSRVVAPAGSYLIYPAGSTFTTGDDFSFPPGTILYIAPGGALENSESGWLLAPRTFLGASPSPLPTGVYFTSGGKQVPVNTLFPQGSEQRALASHYPLVHGGFVPVGLGFGFEFSGEGGIEDALRKSFDIELRAPATASGGGLVVTMAAETVIRPLAGRRLLPPPALRVTDAVFTADSYVRAGFATRPRHVRVPMPREPGAVTVDVIAESPYNAPVVIQRMMGVHAHGLTAAISHAGAANPPVSIVFDEDTQFFIPPGTEISLAVSVFADPSDPSALLTLMSEVALPANTGIFDIDAAPPLGEIEMAAGGHPKMLINRDATIVTLVQAVENLYQVTGGGIGLTIMNTVTTVLENRLMLYPDADMYMFVGGSVALVPGGSIVDVAAGIVHSPRGTQRTKRVADDMGIRSAGMSHIFLEQPVTLRADVPQVQLEETGGVLGAVKTVGPTLVARYITYNSAADGWYTSSGQAVEDVEMTEVVLSAGTFIQIPPGADIDFLSDRVGSTTVTVTELADSYRLPPGAAAIVPRGQQAVAQHIFVTVVVSNVTTTVGGVVTVFPVTTNPITASVTTPLTLQGPAFLELASADGSAAMAMVNARSYLGHSPLLLLNDDAYLYDNDNIDQRSTVFVRIPKSARLDMHGNIEQRAGDGLLRDFLPPESIALLENFPMIYAVAPECRRTTQAPGPDCAEGPEEGLTFRLLEGEQYVLRQPYEIESAALITSRYGGVQLSVLVHGLNTYAPPRATVLADSLHIDHTSGLVQMAGAVPGYTPAANDRLVVASAAADSRRDLHVYLNRNAQPGADLRRFSYVTAQTLTVYSGGYVGRNYALAAGGLTLTTSTHTVFYGAGSRLQQIAAGEKIFGRDSSAAAGGVTVDLAEFVFSGNGSYQATVETTALAAAMDVYGGLYASATVNGQAMVADQPQNIQEALRSATAAGFINVAPGAAIPMETGYLWQGYVPQSSEFVVRRNEAMLTAAYVKTLESYRDLNGYFPPSMARHVTVTTSVFPDSALYLRIQSTVAQLNSFGSGLERPESQDRTSFSHFQQGRSSAGALTGEPYWFYGASRHTRTEAAPGGGFSFNSYRYADFFTAASGAPSTEAGEAGVNTLPASDATESFAALMDGSNPTALGRQRGQLTMAVAVRNLRTGEVALTLAAWRPVVQADDGTVITGYVRVNSGSSAPMPDSGDADSTSTAWVNYFVDTGVTPAVTVSYLLHEWMGRHNRSGNPEDGYLDGFMCNGNPTRASFNVPHTDLTGTAIGTAAENVANYRVWPSAERRQAHLNNTSGAWAPVASNGGAYDAFTPLSRPVYATIAYADSYNAPQPAVTLGSPYNPSYRRDFAAGQTVTVHTSSDWMFYMDRAYHSRADAVYSPVPQQTLYFGDDFSIQGPAAIVPPLGAQQPEGTRLVNAERSNIITSLLPDIPPIVESYYQQTGDCRATDDCARLFNNPHWFPVLRGALTFDGLEVAFTVTGTLSDPSGPLVGVPLGHDDIRVVFPQPHGVVDTAAGTQVTIYAGSIIYPRRHLIQAAVPLPQGDYELYTNSDIVAHVDVSPVRYELNHEVRQRRAQAFDGGIFNYAPAVADDPDCVVEPLGFTTPGPHFDLDPRAIAYATPQPVVYAAQSYDLNTNTPADSGICTVLTGAEYLGCYSDGDTNTANPYWFRYGVIHDTLPPGPIYDDHRAFGSTSNRITPAPPSFGTQPNRGRNHTFEPIRQDGSFNRGYLADGDGAALLAAYYAGAPAFTSARGYAPHGVSNDGSGSAVVATLPSRNTDVPLGNPSAFQWQVAGEHFLPLGVADITVTDYATATYSKVGVRVTTDASEFEALRLAHRITIPRSARVRLRGYNPDPYPKSADDFFTFPFGSEAIVVNADMGSFLAAHPFIGLYQQGAEIGLLDASTVVVATMTVLPDNDSYRRVDLSGKRVVHYLRSEPSQHREPLSAVPIYTNVWLRLPDGGRLVNNTTGEVVQLSPNAVVNPVFGTYLQSSDEAGSGGFVTEPMTNQFYARAQVNGHVVRPALILPAGARLQVGAAGGSLRNVKAAVFFSLTPLESVQCPTGVLGGYGGQAGAPVQINQRREGAIQGPALAIIENNYGAATGRPPLDLGHPCLWLDDPENMDGDRFFIYRSRRRYADEELRIRSLSNDRTYLLGGRLELNA